MALHSKGGQIVKNKPRGNIVKVEDNKEEVKLNANDTDFLLKLFMDSQFKGSEIDKAHGVLSKLAKLHRDNLNG